MQRAEDVLPEFGIHVQKTQITHLIRHAFACVSPPAVHSKDRITQRSITLTSGLDHPLASARIDAKSEAYPGRWTHHLVISDAAELDSELFAWLHEANELSARKRSVLQTGTAGSLLAAAHEDGQRQPSLLPLLQPGTLQSDDLWHQFANLPASLLHAATRLGCPYDAVYQ
jgi:hypothetical protein